MKIFQVFLVNNVTFGADETTPILVDFLQDFDSLEDARRFVRDRPNAIIIDRETLRVV